MIQEKFYQLEVLHEIAMAIGTSLEMAAMLDDCLPLFLRRLSCATAAVVEEQDGRLVPVRVLPRGKKLAALLPSLAVALADDTRPVLPLFAVQNGRYYYFWRLPRFGALVLGRGRHFDQAMIEEIAALADKLAVALRSCRQHAELESTLRSNAELIREISWQANHDPLTDLPNRRLFARRLSELLRSAARGGVSHVLIYLDLDQFKVVNDTCGHAAGDQLLRQLAARLRDQVGRADTLARLGGDEFGILLEGCSSREAISFAEKIIASIKSLRFPWQDKIFMIGASAGIAIIGPGSEEEELLAAADTACQLAKERGRNRVQLYSSENTALATRRGEMYWAARLTSVIEQDGLVLYGQCIVPIRHPDRPHIEVLLRMKEAGGDLLAPASFIPAAERYGLITELDIWVVRRVLALRRLLPPRTATQTWAVNISGASINDNRFLRFLEQEIDRSGLPAGAICFEITETAAISNITRAREFISTMKAAGCLFALDDFGSGLASFAYLQHLSVDFLKIDGSFVRQVADSALDRSIVEAVVRIGHTLGIQTIAECVEHEKSLVRLVALGVDYAQGYFLHRPQPLEELLADGQEEKGKWCQR